MMIYGIGLLVGILNGMFASGAGQVLVFYLIFVKKMETHRTRALSVAILSVSSIFAVIGYLTMVNYKISYLVVFSGIALIAGWIGSKLMKKIPSDILNLVAGILLVLLTGYRMLSGGKS